MFLSVYDDIWDYLDEIGILEEVQLIFEDLIGKESFPKHQSVELYRDMVLEYALFNYNHENKLLIEYLSEHLPDSLEERERKQFMELLDTKRRNLVFIKKSSRDEADIYGKMMYDFYFRDADTDEIIIIVSSTELEKKGHELNMRLIRNPSYPNERYNVIGLIHTPDQLKNLSMRIMLKKAEANFDIARKRKDILFEQSKKLSFDEIKSFEDKNSYFIEQDRIIMKLNKMFYEQFKMDIDDFSDSVFELSNDKARFRDMYEFYLLISKELEDACLDTNYMLDIKFITYTPLLKAFAGFVLADIGLLENGLAEVKMEAIREFESTKNNFLSRTREKIMAHEKKIIKDTIDDLNSSKDVSEKEKAQHYSEFLRKISEFKPESIEQFLTEMIAFLRNECIRLKHLEDEQLTEMKINYLEHLRANPDEIPYLKDVEKENEKIIFDDEKYYDYLDMPDDMYYLTKLLVCARLFFRKEYKKAYTLVCELNFDKNNCFAEMFFIGKVLSLFEDKGYKQYFKQAKKIDKPRYKTELEEFLAWKDDFKRIENRV